MVLIISVNRTLVERCERRFRNKMYIAGNDRIVNSCTRSTRKILQVVWSEFEQKHSHHFVSLWWVGTYQYFISYLCKKMGFVLKLQDKEQHWCPCFKSSCKCSRVQFSSLMFLIILAGLNLLFESPSFFCSTHVFLLNFATSALCICTIIQTFGMIMPHGMLKMALQTRLRWFSKGLSRLYQVIILSF